MLTIAISKGRLYDEAIPLLGRCGIVPAVVDSRKFLLETNDPEIRLLIVRSADVPVYVARGIANLGIVGQDMLMECPGQGLYAPLDLGIGCCRMVLAGLRGEEAPQRVRPRVATKYVRSARDWFARQGRQAEIIKLYGSMELAPSLGLADQIVDLVDTGNTLRANGLEEREVITRISARLIVNRAAMKLRRDQVEPLLELLEQTVSAA